METQNILAVVAAVLGIVVAGVVEAEVELDKMLRGRRGCEEFGACWECGGYVETTGAVQAAPSAAVVVVEFAVVAGVL